MQETRVIDNITFIVDPLGAMSALKLKADILGAVGSSLASLMGGNKGLDSDVDLAPVIEKLIMKLDPLTIEKLTKQLMFRANVVFEDSPQMKPLSNEVNFNRAFSQNLMTFYKLVWFVIQVNYKDFLEQVGNIGGLFPTPTTPKEQKSTKSSKKSSAK